MQENTEVSKLVGDCFVGKYCIYGQVGHMQGRKWSFLDVLLIDNSASMDLPESHHSTIFFECLK